MRHRIAVAILVLSFAASVMPAHGIGPCVNARLSSSSARQRDLAYAFSADRHAARRFVPGSEDHALTTSSAGRAGMEAQFVIFARREIRLA